MKCRFVKVVMIGVIGFLILIIGFLIEITCHRGPSESELIEHFESDLSIPVWIDKTEGDIGFFGIKIGEDEQFFIETSEQWVLPGSKYRWEH